jgi:glycosyltransferase involved in cell wall biosynthesis
LPTRGENFGHAILDALAAGVPVLISDKTPFENLEHHGAGWSFPLSEHGPFVERIEAVAAMGGDERFRLRTGARRLAEWIIEKGDAVATNRKMFNTVLRGRDARCAPSN